MAAKKAKATAKRKSYGRSDLGIRYANLRKRAKTAIRSLEKEFQALTSRDQASWRGQALREQQQRISEAAEQTKLGRRSGGQWSSEKLLQAKEGENKLVSMLGEPVRGGQSKAEQARQRQDRQNRMFRAEVRAEEEGGTGARLHGQAGKYHFERIFYMSTQSVWAGLPNQDRDAAIMKALGVSSLEEAYDIIIAGNAEAIAAMKDLNLTGTGWEVGYTEISGYITDIADIMADYR